MTNFMMVGRSSKAAAIHGGWEQFGGCSAELSYSMNTLILKYIIIIIIILIIVSLIIIITHTLMIIIRVCVTMTNTH